MHICQWYANSSNQEKSTGISENENRSEVEGNSDSESSQVMETQDNVGIATGNWGCGAFGGDPEIKSIIQWLAASQVLSTSGWSFSPLKLHSLGNLINVYISIL